MPGPINVSEATALALHAMILITTSDDRPNTKYLATKLQASSNHLSKVLQKLVKHTLLHSARGPQGGFSITRKLEDITLLEIYELFEGPLSSSPCLFKHEICAGDKCIMGEASKEIVTNLNTYLRTTTLENFKDKSLFPNT